MSTFVPIDATASARTNCPGGRTPIQTRRTICSSFTCSFGFAVGTVESSITRTPTTTRETSSGSPILASLAIGPCTACSCPCLRLDVALIRTDASGCSGTRLSFDTTLLFAAATIAPSAKGVHIVHCAARTCSCFSFERSLVFTNAPRIATRALVARFHFCSRLQLAASSVAPFAERVPVITTSHPSVRTSAQMR